LRDSAIVIDIHINQEIPEYTSTVFILYDILMLSKRVDRSCIIFIRRVLRSYFKTALRDNNSRIEPTNHAMYLALRCYLLMADQKEQA